VQSHGAESWLPVVLKDDQAGSGDKIGAWHLKTNQPHASASNPFSTLWCTGQKQPTNNQRKHYM
jgi:hypothetical protein